MNIPISRKSKMARVKNVRALRHLCLIQVCQLIIFTSQSICSPCGPYITFKCRKQLNFVQKYILNRIHPHFLDDIVSTLDKLTTFQWLVNDRVKCSIMAVCMHPYMKCFKPKFQLPVNDELYMYHLKSMNNLRTLNLSMVCTDEILEIVGRSCPLLESIDITSKVESATNSSIRFNALKLRFFVSDLGLEYLHQCKLLKRIIMNGIIRSNCGGRKISNTGIKNLLLNLDMLKFINYQDMGLVLDEISSHDIKWGLLNLVHLQDNHVTLEHIDLFAILCPKLQSLSLCIPQTNPRHNLSESCLNRLASNSICLSSIDLRFFAYNQPMIYFLMVKGKYLTSLSLKDCKDVESYSLIEICNNCPNLKILKLNLLKQSHFEVMLPKECYFKYLEELYLAGTQWDPNLIFNICIFQCVNLRILSLLNKNFSCKLDREIKSLLHRNPLLDLTEISLLEGCKVSFPLLKDFLLYCKSLERITVVDDVSENLAERLIHFISSTTFDISMDIKFGR